ncbi:MAG: hypothetical protein Q4G43_01470 [Mobilicoccus sp.]|nr:hypothetical protein [Mobilicoccus sp.]
MNDTQNGSSRRGPAEDQSSRESWVDAMVVELRLRDVRGSAIGDAIASVEAHCAESGERPQEAFGDPVEYARSLDFRDQDIDALEPRSWLSVLAPTLAGVAGAALTGAAVSGWASGGDVPVTWGAAASAAILVVVTVLTITSLRLLLAHPVWGAVALGAAFASMVLANVLLTGVILSLPVMLVGLVAVALLAASVIGLRRERGRVIDPVTDPIDGRDRYGALRGGFRHPWGEWIFVIAAVGIAALNLIVS